MIESQSEPRGFLTTPLERTLQAQRSFTKTRPEPGTDRHARARAPSAWLVANVLNALLISPSNRSEAAVGYATMDGDTCGSISPLAGVDKSFIQQWLRWLADIGPEEIGNLPELNNIIAQKPSAELRPQSYAQTDEEDLMPYAWLDRWSCIEMSATRLYRVPVSMIFFNHYYYKCVVAHGIHFYKKINT